MAAGYFKAHCLKLMDDVKKFHKDNYYHQAWQKLYRLVPVRAKEKKPLFGYFERT